MGLPTIMPAQSRSTGIYVSMPVKLVRLCCLVCVDKQQQPQQTTHCNTQHCLENSRACVICVCATPGHVQGQDKPQAVEPALQKLRSFLHQIDEDPNVDLDGPIKRLRQVGHKPLCASLAVMLRALRLFSCLCLGVGWTVCTDW